MKVKPEQLVAHLKQNLARIYLLYGDEPLLIDESRQAIREMAKEQGYDEFRRLTVESPSQWDELSLELQSYSMFGQKRFFEIALPSGKPGIAGASFLSHYASQPNSQDTLLIFCGKLESSAQKSAWVKAIDAAGIVIVHYSIERSNLPAWIAQRLKAQGLQADKQAIECLADHVDGNLLAAQQEVIKLSLLYGQGAITQAQIQEAMADLSRFSMFDCIDFALSKDIPQLIRALNYLHEEGVEPILLLWNFTREIRQLIEMTLALMKNKNVEQTIKSFYIHYRRQPLLKKQLSHPRLSHWYALLRKSAAVDQMIKGQALGQVWNELSQLYIELAGGSGIR